MPDIRYAIARDPRHPQEEGEEPSYDQSKRDWWQLQREEFGDWDSRRLFAKKSTALAIIWKYRDAYDIRLQFTLIKVTRKTPR